MKATAEALGCKTYWAAWDATIDLQKNGAAETRMSRKLDMVVLYGCRVIKAHYGMSIQIANHIDNRKCESVLIDIRIHWRCKPT